MKPQKTHKECCVCSKEFKMYRTTDKYCSPQCKAKDAKKKPLTDFQKKKCALKRQYEVIRIRILTEAKFICFVDDCTRLATTIEHQKGRKGYADKWARDNDIPLLIDERFLKPCCPKHNQEFETNPELSRKYQLSKLHDGKKEPKNGRLL